MIGYFRRRLCTRFRPYNRFLIFLLVIWDIWSLFQGFVDLGQICQAQPRREVFVFDWVRWVCSVWENFCWNLPAFWLWPFLLNLRLFDCQIVLKGSCCLSFLDWALCRSCLCVELQSPGCNVGCQVSPNICLQICLKELLLFSWITHTLSTNLSDGWYLLSELGLLVSAKSFWRGPAACLFGLSSVPFLSLCRASVAGLQRRLPSIS